MHVPCEYNCKYHYIHASCVHVCIIHVYMHIMCPCVHVSRIITCALIDILVGSVITSSSTTSSSIPPRGIVTIIKNIIPILVVSFGGQHAMDTEHGKS